MQLRSAAVPSDHEDMIRGPTGPVVKYMLSEHHMRRKFGSSLLPRLGVHQVHLNECSGDFLEQGPKGDPLT